MSVIAEFTVPVDEFAFGRALSTAGGLNLTLEEIVPTTGTTMPYVWASGGDFEAFEREVAGDPNVAAITALDRVDDSVLYRVEWHEETADGLIDAIVESEAVILEAGSNGAWHFRLRFPEHDALARFYNACADLDVPARLERVYTLAEAFGEGRAFDLTPEQREALVLALRRGYFDTPRETTLAELADELDISQQALSSRVRLGNEKVLRRALLSSAVDLPD